MRIPWWSRARRLLLLSATGLGLSYAVTGTPAAEPPQFPAWSLGTAPAAAAPCTDPLNLLPTLSLVEGEQAPHLPPARLDDTDKPLPINLATALRLAGGRPLEIAAAEASLRTAQAQYDEAKLLWLPNIYVGASYYRHDGASQGNSGTEFITGRSQFMAGGGLTAVISGCLMRSLRARAGFAAGRAASRTLDIQTARNDALEEVAEAYFNVQQERGRLAGATDAADKARELERTITALGKDLVPPIEVHRVRTQLAVVEEAEASAREQWRAASADLTRALRLDPGAVVVPQEPPFLQVTILAPQSVDALIPIGLTNRPELASQQALVQATLARLKEERLRPLVPSLVLGGDATPAAPGGYLMGGVFGSGTNGSGNAWAGKHTM